MRWSYATKVTRSAKDARQRNADVALCDLAYSAGEAAAGGEATMRFAVALLLLAASTAGQAAPQSPLATGSAESILHVIKAAHRCGIVAVRTRPGRNGNLSLFVNEEPADRAAYTCIEAWLARNAGRLGLMRGYRPGLHTPRSPFCSQACRV